MILSRGESRGPVVRNAFRRGGPNGAGKQALFAGVIFLAGCTAQLGTSDENSTGSGDDQGNGQDGPGKELLDEPSAATRFRRLTHDEWKRTVVELFGEKHVAAADDLRPDARSSGFVFDNAADALEVDGTLWAGYQRAATRIAESVALDATLIERWAGEGTEAERAGAFIDALGALTFRRPLTDEQRQRYLAIFELGKTAFEETTGYGGGVRLVIEALLQSPHFLYRVELSSELRDGMVQLDAYERAQRLSYFLWGTMPDDELLRAAAEGKLEEPTDVGAQVERMLDDPRAIDVVWNFHRQLLDVARYEAIAPAPAAFPDVGDALPGSAARETELFVRNIAEEGGGLNELLLSTTTFVDATLAGVYGLEGTFDEAFKRVTLAADRRSGVLTQVGFLASHATSVDPDPIHRGVFIAKRLACTDIAAPPDDVPPLPPAGKKSNRQLVEDHTEQEGTACPLCHASIINPLGFPFEMYDAIGAYRETDRGHVVETAAQPLIDGEPTDVADAVALSEALASSKDVAECYASHWVELAHGRAAAPGDTLVVAQVAELLQTRSLGMLDVLAEVAVSKAFLNRSPEVE